ncbi:MAG: UDP-N-acetylglucosamine 2-epimerase (non-hydrolyzing) [Candidatus Thermoplasmatota archaeon]
MTVAVVVGTRPELIKMAPVLFALEDSKMETILIHTGQHYDENLSAQFLTELGIRQPDYHLEVGSDSQARQAAECMMRLEAVFDEVRPKCMLVEGDTNTVLAGALTAAKMGITVGHVEAGLRSMDRRMPEEYNRRVADHISHLLFAPTRHAAKTLRGEKVWGKIYITGNTVIDACERYAPISEHRSGVIRKIPFDEFILVTAHRAENVDDPGVLASLVRVLTSAPLPIVYPIHPRTQKRLREMDLYTKLAKAKRVHLLPPVGYFDMLALLRRCAFILTDSGGIQEEATAPSIRKRVLVFRENTERPEAVEAGYARVVGTDAKNVSKALLEEWQHPAKPCAPSPYGDGKGGERIARIVAKCKGMKR